MNPSEPQCLQHKLKLSMLKHVLHSGQLVGSGRGEFDLKGFLCCCFLCPRLRLSYLHHARTKSLTRLP